MPPLKEYIFINIYDERISITIDAYSFESAYFSLIETVKHPANFKCINLDSF